MNHIKKLMAVLVVMTLAACAEQEGQRVELGQDTAAQRSDQRRESWPPEVVDRVDSANAAYAAEDYETAAEVFRALTREHPDLGTVWFGLYMAESALGNTEAATAALERAEAINPGLGQMHQAAEAQAASGMPMGHPSLDSVNPEDAPTLDENLQPTETTGGEDDGTSNG